jgi:hypothetical protein
MNPIIALFTLASLPMFKMAHHHPINRPPHSKRKGRKQKKNNKRRK